MAAMVLQGALAMPFGCMHRKSVCLSSDPAKSWVQCTGYRGLRNITQCIHGDSFKGLTMPRNAEAQMAKNSYTHPNRCQAPDSFSV